MGIACAVDLRRPKIKWRRRTGSGACYLNDLGLGASRERQNKKKNITVAQLAGTANVKPRTLNEQSEQRRVADASSADLRLPKARQRDQGRCHPVFLQFVGTAARRADAAKIKSQLFTNEPEDKRVEMASSVDLRQSKARHRGHRPCCLELVLCIWNVCEPWSSGPASLDVPFNPSSKLQFSIPSSFFAAAPSRTSKKDKSAVARSQRAGRRPKYRGQSGGAPQSPLDSFLCSLPANGNSFGDCPATDPKLLQINHWLKDEQVGIALLADTNRRWPLPAGQRLPDRMRAVSRVGHFSTMATDQHLSGHQLIFFGFSMWEHHISIQHSDLSLQAQVQIRQIDAAIHSLFDTGTADLPHTLHQFLSADRGRVLRMSSADKEFWPKLLRLERPAPRRYLPAQRGTLRPFFFVAGRPP